MELIGDIEEEKIRTLYFKTGDESLYELGNSSSKENHIMRKEFLKLHYCDNNIILYKGSNCIIIEYFKRLKEIDNEVESFRKVNLKKKSFRGIK